MANGNRNKRKRAGKRKRPSQATKSNPNPPKRGRKSLSAQASKRDEERRETYSTWPPEEGTFHYVRVVEEFEKSVIMEILCAEPLEAVEMVPAPHGPRWITPEEYIRTTKTWKELCMANFDGPAPMTSMPARALGEPGIFTRPGALLDSNNEVCGDEVNTTCASCNKELQAIDYSHCLECKKYVHNKCVADKHCPLQIIGTELCDNGGTPIACPGCGGVKTIKAVDVPVTQHLHEITIVFDPGSANMRCSTSTLVRKLSGTPLPTEWQPLDEPLLSPFYVNTSGNIDLGTIGYERDDDFQYFGNPKRLLYDSDCRRQLSELGFEQPVKAVFGEFFSASLALIKKEQDGHIERFVEGAMADAAMPSVEPRQLPPFECYILVATPAKVDEDQRDELLTAASEACTKFFTQNYNVHIVPTVCDVREPEMALAGTPGSKLWTDPAPQSEPVWTVTFDLGGSTYDFAIIEWDPDNNPLLIRYYGSDTEVCGNTHMVNRILEEMSMNRGKYAQVAKWVQTRIDKQDAPNTLVDGKDLSTVWEAIRKDQVTKIEHFLVRTLEIVLSNAPVFKRKRIQWYITGGGALDDAVYDRFQKAISKRFPVTTIVRDRFSKSRSSSVLRGLIAYAEFCRSQRVKRSPLSILALQDAFQHDESSHSTAAADNEQDPSTHRSTADIGDHPADDHGSQLYLICVNKGDPLGPEPLLPSNRVDVSLGNILCFYVSWGDERKTNIPLYAYPEHIEHVIVHEGFSCAKFTTVEQDKLFLLGRIAIPMPPGDQVPNHVYLQWIRASPWARTVTIKAFILKDDTDFNPSDTGVLCADQCLFNKTMTFGLDTFGINRASGS